jgi:hypothetical protein
MNMRQSQLLHYFLVGGPIEALDCRGAPRVCHRLSGEQVSLQAGTIWSQEPCKKQRLYCERGVLWITQTNSTEDYLLHAGESFTLNEYSKVVVQALEGAVFHLSDMPD